MRSLRSILVTGGAGFIGSTLVRKLLEREDLEKLTILDKLTYAGNRRNLIGPDRDPRLELIEGDLLDRSLLDAILTNTPYTGILNLAAETHVDRSIDCPQPFINTNIQGVATLLDAARHHQVALLQCSTDEVYGRTPAHQRFDEFARLNPSSPYAASKASADLLVQAAFKTHHQEVIITRFSNNYGPRQHREKLIPKLIYQALRDLPLPIYGSGQQIRDWMHVDDCCLGIIAAFEKGPAGRIFNLGAKSEHTNLGIARGVLKILKKPEKLITHVEDRLGHDDRYALDPRQALRVLQWRARIPFRSGFEATVRELAAELRPEE